MAKCGDCEKDMSSDDTKSCTWPYLVVDGKRYKRDTDYYDLNLRCHDCHILNKRGNVHHWGCDMERCPICGGQLISCECLSGKQISVARVEVKGGESGTGDPSESGQ